MMSLLSLAPRLRRPVAVAALSLAFLATGRALPERNFETSHTLATEVSTMVELLEQVNFNHESVNREPKDKLGGDLIHDYMADLDPNRMFFLTTDQEAFTRRYASGAGLYYTLRTLGRLDSAFDIYVQYEKRVENRVNWIFDDLNKEFDFTTHETFPIDRTKSAWPATEAEANDLWHRRLKFELLQELLDKKTLVQAKQDVHHRYERLLKNLADTDTDEVAEIFLTSLANLFDPHSTYFSAETYEDFGIQMRLSLVGIGALLGKEDDQIVIKELIPGGPADLSKQLHVNDKIVAVTPAGGETVDLIGLKLRKVVDLIRGEKGTKVRLTVIPAGVTDESVHKDIALTRDVVKLNSARARAAIYQVPGPGGAAVPIGVITLPSFYGLSGDEDDADANEAHASATQDVADLLTRLEGAGIKGLVLDLRNNGGGLLSEAINLTGLFINKGPVVQVKSFSGEIQVDDDDDSKISYTGPMAVLTSRFSASASEIVAGALQNYGRAIVIGDSSTHGKGSVQTVVEMKNVNRLLAMLPDTEKTGAAKLTIQKFYLPNGASTQNKGVTPDIILPSVDDYMPIGESDLPHALIWDEIPSAKFTGHPLDPKVLLPLREASQFRLEHLEEFALLRKNIDWFKAKQAMKEISLNLVDREHQKAADDAFKKTVDAERGKLAKSDYPYKEFTLVPPPPKPEAAAKPAADNPDDDDSDTLSTDEDAGITAVDIPLRESLRVLSDALSLSKNPQYWADGAAPLTIQVAKSG
ncbi:MAG TPA: carboxy terminal-processing peptidase [Opitutaceae bacterium]|nr:carboxy terminal-processing peptidase [Opitutaceae bacterium]